MESAKPPAGTLSPAEVFACMYHELERFGADVRGYDAIRPLGRLFNAKNDPFLGRRLAAELTAVDTLMGLLRDIAEGYVTAPYSTLDQLRERADLVRLCQTASDCQVHLRRYLERVVGRKASATMVTPVGWQRLELRLMAPWS